MNGHIFIRIVRENFFNLLKFLLLNTPPPNFNISQFIHIVLVLNITLNSTLPKRELKYTSHLTHLMYIMYMYLWFCVLCVL